MELFSRRAQTISRLLLQRAASRTVHTVYRTVTSKVRFPLAIGASYRSDLQTCTQRYVASGMRVTQREYNTTRHDLLEDRVAGKQDRKPA